MFLKYDKYEIIKKQHLYMYHFGDVDKLHYNYSGHFCIFILANEVFPC
jgi:hypothetical protein